MILTMEQLNLGIGRLGQMGQVYVYLFTTVVVANPPLSPGYMPLISIQIVHVY